MLQRVVNQGKDDANELMDRIGIPKFGEDLLEQVQGIVGWTAMFLKMLSLSAVPCNFPANVYARFRRCHSKWGTNDNERALMGPKPTTKTAWNSQGFQQPGKAARSFQNGTGRELGSFDRHRQPHGSRRRAHARTEFRFCAEQARWKEAHASELCQQVIIMWHCLMWMAGSNNYSFFPALA